MDQFPGPEATRITLDLPLPPSVNRLWKIGKNRKSGKRQMYRSPEYERWLVAAGWEVQRQKPGLPVKTIHGLYSLSVRLRLGVGSDLDNRIKAISDLLQAQGIIENDKLCRKLEVIWEDDLPVECRITLAAMQHRSDR